MLSQNHKGIKNNIDTLICVCGQVYGSQFFGFPSTEAYSGAREEDLQQKKLPKLDHMLLKTMNQKLCKEKHTKSSVKRLLRIVQ